MLRDPLHTHKHNSNLQIMVGSNSRQDGVGRRRDDVNKLLVLVDDISAIHIRFRLSI